MPLDEISEFIELYDNSRPRIDELKFVSDLCAKYNTDSKTLTKRVREVRRINRFKNTNETHKR